VHIISSAVHDFIFLLKNGFLECPNGVSRSPILPGACKVNPSMCSDGYHSFTERYVRRYADGHYKHYLAEAAHSLGYNHDEISDLIYLFSSMQLMFTCLPFVFVLSVNVFRVVTVH